MIRAIIIDDEERARRTLQTLLREYCQEVEVLQLCKNVPEGVIAINQLRPDLVFLDIEMPEYNGFELLSFFREVDFEIIFVTAYEHHAVKAFSIAAVDYLLKPLEVELLVAAVKKAVEKREYANMEQRLDILKEAFKGTEVNKIALPMSDGLLFVVVNQIMFIAAEGAYTHAYLEGGSKLTVSKNLRFFEELLENRALFFRPHRSHIVNLNFIRKYLRGEGTLIMDNSYTISISRDKKQEFETQLRQQRLTL